MLQVKRIGHATLTTPDLERQLDYYTRVVGLSVVAKEKGRAVLATKPGQEVIVLEHGDRPAGVRLSFQVAPGSDLDELSARLSKAGIKCEPRSDITPGIARAVVFRDPKGTSVEIFADYGFAKEDDNDTGVVPRKLGHVAFHTPDVAGTVKFYCDVLGFKVSDWRSDYFAFLRCSRDHHTINLLQADNANIHHIAFELRDEAEINRACDFLARKNIKLFWGPIRHLIGHNIAIYHKNPDGITIEFFTDLDIMHDEDLGYFEPRPWHQDRPQRPKVWGDDTPTNYWGPGTRTTCRGRRSKHHCAFAPVSRITLPHSAVSSTKNCAACAGAPATGSSISSFSFALTSGCRTISARSLWIFSAVEAGVPGGATQANHVIERKPGSPDSEKVGTCGKAPDRARSAMANIFAVPARCKGDEVTAVSNIMSTWPATMSLSAGPAPR